MVQIMDGEPLAEMLLRRLNSRLTCPQKVKHRIAIRPQAVILVIPFLGRTKKNSKQVFKPFLYMDVHSSTIHNSRKAETPQMPISNEGIDKL